MEIKLKVKRVARLESSVILDLIEVRSEKHSASDSNNLSSRHSTEAQLFGYVRELKSYYPSLDTGEI